MGSLSAFYPKSPLRSLHPAFLENLFRERNASICAMRPTVDKARQEGPQDWPAGPIDQAMLSFRRPWDSLHRIKAEAARISSEPGQNQTEGAWLRKTQPSNPLKATLRSPKGCR